MMGGSTILSSLCCSSCPFLPDLSPLLTSVFSFGSLTASSDEMKNKDDERHLDKLATY